LVKGQKDPAPYRTLRQVILEQLKEGARDDTFPLKPQRVLRDLRAQMGREVTIFSYVAAHKLGSPRTFPGPEPITGLIWKDYEAWGFAHTAAVAAKLVHATRTVVSLSGYGGFLRIGQELETEQRLGLSVGNVNFPEEENNRRRWKD